jgi:hypothetical protein
VLPDPKTTRGAALVKRQRLPEHVIDTVALLQAHGVSWEEIAQTVQVSEEKLRRAARQNAGLIRKRDAYLAEILKTIPRHRHRLARMMDESYDAIQNALGSDDQRLAAETAFKVLDRAVPPAKSGEAQGTSISVTMNNLNLVTEAKEAVEGITGEISNLLEKARDVTPRHEHSSEEALPASYRAAREDD